MARAGLQLENRIAVGWREWVALPQIGIAAIKTKIDTGARTSALHAFRIVTFRANGVDRIRFDIHPWQRRTDKAISCTADVLDRRWVSDSGGHRELRYVIKTQLRFGNAEWPIEITLTDRDPMRFRMLLGRTAMQDRVHIVPDASYLLGRVKATRAR